MKKSQLEALLGAASRADRLTEEERDALGAAEDEIRNSRDEDEFADDEEEEIPEDTPSLDTSFHDHEMDVD